MKIIVADVLGMCFGVRDALAVLDHISQPETVTIHGELVHNEKVLHQLQLRGFHQVDEKSRTSLPLTETVLITAHGISHRERSRLELAGKNLVDTTCPLVTRAHQAAQNLQEQGYHVLVIGKRGHVEIQGVIEDLQSYDVIEKPEEVINFPHAKLGIMCQTTTPVPHAREIREKIIAKNPQAEVRFIDTICHPTKDHQSALEKLLTEAEAVVVVGGRNSNNTKQLVRKCQEKGIPAFHIQDAQDIRTEWFVDFETVGLTAGTSTLEETIQEVYQRLTEMRKESRIHAEKVVSCE